MFRIVTVEDVVRIPPQKFGDPIDDVAKEQIKLKYENYVDEELGYVILVTGVDVENTGKILPGDGSTHHRATFKLLTFFPELHEVVEGEIVEVTDFGAFVRIGPEDALLHVSQIMDDFITYDEKHGVLAGRESHRNLGKGNLGERQDNRRQFSKRRLRRQDRHNPQATFPWQNRMDSGGSEGKAEGREGGDKARKG